MKALILLLLALSTCHALDRQQSCTEGPDFVMAISGSATGSGTIASSYEDACQLIASDYGGDIDSWCFILATHGYDADPRTGLLKIGNVTYRIATNGSLIA